MSGQMPPLVKNVVVKSGLFSATSRPSNINLQVFGRAFIQAGVACQIVTRQLKPAPEKGRSGFDLRHIICLKFDGEVFNLRGSCGWDQIGQDYANMCGGMDWCWIGEETDGVISGVEPLSESHMVMQLIREEQALELRDMLAECVEVVSGQPRKTNKGSKL